MKQILVIWNEKQWIIARRHKALFKVAYYIIAYLYFRFVIAYSHKKEFFLCAILL